MKSLSTFFTSITNILFSFERHFTKFWPTKPNPPVIKIFSLYNFFNKNSQFSNITLFPLQLLIDSDGDLIEDRFDLDDDNDDVLDINDAYPLDPNSSIALDSDNDGVDDLKDQFPNDPTEQYDTDLDGIGNKTDMGEHNDGF